MRILQLCQKPPLPAIDGGCIASHRLTLDLENAGHQVKVLSIATQKHPFLPEQIDHEYETKFNFEAVPINTEVRLLTIIGNLFSKNSIQNARFYSPLFSKRVLELMANNSFDLIILDGMMTCFYLGDIKENSTIPIAYRSHNIEWSLLNKIRFKGNPLKSIYAKFQSTRLQREEVHSWQNADLVFPISTEDEKKIKKAVSNPEKVVHLPFTIDYNENKSLELKKSAFHIGAMDWKPNIDGIEWTLDNVWPKVTKSNKDATLHLAGKSITDWNHTLNLKSVVVHESVEDARKFIREHGIMLVPVRIASGTRIKILQGLAEGVGIVSTPEGVHGMGLKNNEELIVARNAEEFIRAILDLFTNFKKLQSLVVNGQKFLSKHHSSQSFAVIFNEQMKSNFQKE